MSSMPYALVSGQHHPRPEVEVVLGVDTHKDTHTAAAVTVEGVLLGQEAFATTGAGYQQLLAWAQSFGTVARAGVEGTGSYGAALTRHLLAAGVAVIEVNRPDRATRRRRGKTDAIDAEMAALAVLSGRASRTWRAPQGVPGSLQAPEGFDFAITIFPCGTGIFMFRHSAGRWQTPISVNVQG